VTANAAWLRRDQRVVETPRRQDIRRLAVLQPREHIGLSHLHADEVIRPPAACGPALTNPVTCPDSINLMPPYFSGSRCGINASVTPARLTSDGPPRAVRARGRSVRVSPFDDEERLRADDGQRVTGTAGAAEHIRLLPTSSGRGTPEVAAVADDGGIVSGRYWRLSTTSVTHSRASHVMMRRTSGSPATGNRGLGQRERDRTKSSAEAGREHERVRDHLRG